MHLIGRKKENYNARIHYITAKPFFLHRGYHVMKEQEVIRGGIALTNYVMEKKIMSC